MLSLRPHITPKQWISIYGLQNATKVQQQPQRKQKFSAHDCNLLRKSDMFFDTFFVCLFVCFLIKSTSNYKGFVFSVCVRSPHNCRHLGKWAEKTIFGNIDPSFSIIIFSPSTTELQKQWSHDCVCLWNAQPVYYLC